MINFFLASCRHEAVFLQHVVDITLSFVASCQHDTLVLFFVACCRHDAANASRDGEHRTTDYSTD